METKALLTEMENSADALENVYVLISMLMDQLAIRPMPDPSEPFDDEDLWEQWKADYCAAFDVVKGRISDISRSLEQMAHEYRQKDAR